MFCPNCGNNNPDGVAFCANCGFKFEDQNPQQAAPQPEFQQSQQQYQQPEFQQPEFQQPEFQQPYQQPYQQPQQQYQAPYMPPMPAPVPGKALGITGMILGIVSLVLCCLFWYFTFLLSIPGLVLSCIGLSKAKKENAPNSMAIAGIVCSAINIGVNIIFIALVALSIATLGFSIN